MRKIDSTTPTDQFIHERIRASGLYYGDGFDERYNDDEPAGGKFEGEGTLAILMILPAVGLSMPAQSAPVAPAPYMSAADISSGLSTAVAADAAAGAAVTVAPGIAVRRRSGGGEPQYAISLTRKVGKGIDGTITYLESRVRVK